MAKNLTDEKLKWTLEINGSPAQKELHKLSQSTSELEKTNKALRVELKKLEAQGKKGTEEYKNLREEFRTIGYYELNAHNKIK